MEELRKIIQSSLNEDFLNATISAPRDKSGVLRIKVRPVLKKGQLLFQIEEFKNNQAFHRNCSSAEAEEYIVGYLSDFKQINIETRQYSYTVLISKKGKVTISKKNRESKIPAASLAHDREKCYILREGMNIPFLRDLGVMTAENKIVKGKKDKFRQINRFLEFIEDILDQFDKSREVTIVDFGCGKSYLTFAMYYYLHEVMGYDIRATGLDLKTEVIEKCNKLSQKYGYHKLAFLEGDIAGYDGIAKADMVVTLHACDTATDYALSKAVEWNAQVILSVPCCQHEVNGQIKSDILAPVFSYGLIKERMAALITDAMRAEYLKGQGYETQILEFVDMEHTPKNILIRAIKTWKSCDNREKIKQCEEFLHISPLLGSLLQQ